MNAKELEDQIDFVMNAALQKCGNLQEAEELTQETLLAALTALKQGRTIDNLRAWLVTVLNRRFYDMLRRKYRQPIVSVGIDFDLPDEGSLLEQISATEEAEEVRREVAYLARIYREVVVQYYMDGKSVAHIAAALQIPEGTVKRRLSTGRDQIRKGVENMEHYARPSYQPIHLNVYNNGRAGLDGEPATLAYKDLVAQNLLWLAYEKPVTINELSRAIGIPAAYVEPVIERLTDGELMKCVGNKYYTDFIISTIEDQERHLPAQRQFVQKYFPLIWESIGKGLKKLCQNSFYQRGTFDQKNSLELYFTIKSLERGYYGTFDQLFREERVFPPRPHGGAWIAMGSVSLGDYDPGQHSELQSCRLSGERQVFFEHYGEAGQIGLHVYGMDGFPAPTYNHCFDEIPLLSRREGVDTTVLKLLYLLHSGLEPNQVGFNTEALKGIPFLIKCKVLRQENGRPVVNIPVMHPEEYRQLYCLCQETAGLLSPDIKEHLAALVRGKRQPIPPHLDSVPLYNQYMWSMYGLSAMTIREAIKRGRLHDGDYDNESGENPPPCPMILTIQD